MDGIWIVQQSGDWGVYESNVGVERHGEGPEMADKRVDQASHGSGIRNAASGQGSDRQTLDNAPGQKGAKNPGRKRREDPVQEVMNSNPNPSPPIKPNP